MSFDFHAPSIIFGLVAILVALVAARTLARWSADPTQAHVRDLFIENGRLSKASVVLMGSFAATTWFFVFYSLTGRMTEGYFVSYAAAWIAPVVARMFTAPADPPKVAP